MVPRPWRERWKEAGGKLYDGRMIALRNDPIWRKISRFGSPVPPFDFNSGMGLEEVNRFEAEALGVELPSDGEEARKLEDMPSDEEIDAAIQKAIQHEKEEIEKNTKSVAEALGVRVGEPMTFKEANELRRRGLDVEARPRVRGLDDELFKVTQDKTRAWETVDGKRPRPVSSGRILENTKPQDALSEITQDVGRYFVTVYWKKFPDGFGGGGHVFTAERLKGGVLRIYDPQSGKIGSLFGGGEFEVFLGKNELFDGFSRFASR